MIKVLLITDNHAEQGGGAEKSFFRLKNELKQLSNIQVFSLGFGPQTEQNNDYAIIKETPSKALRQWWRMFFNPLKYGELRKVITQFQPDIIHLHNIRKYTPTLLKAVQNYPTIQTVHDFSAICPTGWNVHRDLTPCEHGLSLQCLWQHRRHYSFISYFALLFSFLRQRHLAKKTIHHVTAPSPLLASYLQKHFKAVTYIPPFQKELDKTTEKNFKPYHFLYVGQLETQKGIDIILREFALAQMKNPQLILKIAGSGAEENRLKQWVEKVGLAQNVLFVGWVDNLSTLYTECNALIFSSIGLESFGLVITEAMSHSKAVIGANRGPTPWLVEDKKTGLLFNPLKIGDLAEKILFLAGNSELAKRYGEAGRQKLNMFPGNEEILQQILTVYRAYV